MSSPARDGASKSKRVAIPRPALARKGQPIQLMTNHFEVSVRNVNDHFYHYSVNLKYEDDRPVDSKGIGRKVIDKLHQTYNAELGNKDFAYDGEKSLFTLGSLPNVMNEFTVVLEDSSSNKAAAQSQGLHGDESPGENDRKRMRRSFQTKTLKVELNFAAKIPMQAIALALKGQESENSQEALRVLDIILRQHAAKKGCLLVRQSFFHNIPANFTDIGGGVMSCRGFHSSFRPAQNGLSLNIDVTTTMIVRPGQVIDFLIENQKVQDPYSLDWMKAKRALKNLRIKTVPNNQEFRIIGLSDLPCKKQLFSLRQRVGNNGGDGDFQTTEITVYDYFVNVKKIELRYSGDLPCLNVGKPKRPTYFPIELCSLIPLQRYTKALTGLQRASLVEKSRQKPQERMKALSMALRSSNYDSEPMLQACGVSISTNFTKVDGRVLPPPKLKVGNGEDFMPRNGRWNFKNKQVFEATSIADWAVVNFSARCDRRTLVQDLISCASSMGIKVEQPKDVFEEDASMRRAPHLDRVEAMFKKIMPRFPEKPPTFLICLLPEPKKPDIYGPWKRKCLCNYGIITQCMAPMRVNYQYLANCLLKINAKLGGVNSLLHVERTMVIPHVSRVPTIILGMDVSHGSPGHSDIPSFAAVVSSRAWPAISRYRACVKTQSPKLEMVDSLFKLIKDEDGKDTDVGIIKELMLDFYKSSGGKKPENIIIFRDGVSESQFNQVLNIELDQIIEACKFLDEAWSPKFTLLIAQKNHHTRFFQERCPDNVPAGTVVDSTVCHPRNYDFYMCSHAGMIGTTRPTHYHVLLDEIGFTPDDLQELVHSLSYVYQRSTTAISVVAPVFYAHLAASQIRVSMRLDDLSEEHSSSQERVTAEGTVFVPELPRLHANVSSSMFFC